MGNQASWQNRGLHIFLSAASVKKIVWIHKQKLCVSVMDDPRIEWIRDRVYNALDIKENEVFEELLEREDGEFERNLGKFLNDSPEEEVEVECEPEIPDIEEEEEAAPEGEEGAEKEPEEDEPQALPTSEAEPEEEAEAKSAKKSKGKKKGKGKKGAEEEEEPPKQE